MAMSKGDYKEKLIEMGIEFDEDATKSELKELYEGLKEDESGKFEESGKSESSETPAKDKPKQASLQQCLAMLNGKKIDGSDFESE